jgi:hypothetical protein
LIPNSSSNSVTVTAGAGVTITGSGTVATTALGQYKGIVTVATLASEAVTLVRVG